MFQIDVLNLAIIGEVILDCTNIASCDEYDCDEEHVPGAAVGINHGNGAP